MDDVDVRIQETTGNNFDDEGSIAQDFDNRIAVGNDHMGK